MKLRYTLAISALIGFFVPLASYLVWWLAYAIGLGKILDDWNYRAGVFISLLGEIVHARGQAPHYALFDWIFWDVLWVAIITLFVLMEKIAPATWRTSQIAGVALIAWGIWQFVR